MDLLDRARALSQYVPGMAPRSVRQVVSLLELAVQQLELAQVDGPFSTAAAAASPHTPSRNSEVPKALTGLAQLGE